jgi:2-methylcitrate dehydratase PrpD
MTDPKIESIMSKIRLEGRSGEPTLNARLDIKMKDGKAFSESTDTPKGDPTNPMSKDEVISKFMANVDFSKTVSRNNAEKIIDMVDNVEKQDSVKPLISLLVP